MLTPQTSPGAARGDPRRRNAMWLGHPSAITGLLNGMGETPAMGWSSWNQFRCDIDEAMLREVARSLVSSGLRDAGYRYLNVDDCWQTHRTSDGHIQPDAKKFPSGMKALGDYVHSLGLRLGIYSDAGNVTCEKRPGSYGYEREDAADYAEWGARSRPKPLHEAPVVTVTLADSKRDSHRRCRLRQVRLLRHGQRLAADAALLRTHVGGNERHRPPDGVLHLFVGLGRAAPVGG